MNTLLLKQEAGFLMITEEAWSSHIQMIRLGMLQEEGESEASVKEVIQDYANAFEKKVLSPVEIQKYKTLYKLEVNHNRQINSVYGDLMLF